MSVRSVRTFLIEPGRGDEFEQAYRDGDFLARSVSNPGFIRGELIRASTEPPVFVAVAEWETEADYAAWQASYDQLPAEPAARMLATLTADNVAGVVGEVILPADRTTPPPA